MDVNIKNKKALLLGFITAMLFSLIFCELIQGLTALAFGALGLNYKVSGIKLCAYFVLNSGVTLNSIILMLPYFLTIAAIELSVQLLKKHSPGFIRYYIIIFSLALSGFLLFDTFYSAFSVILRFNYGNDWVQMTNLLNMSEGGRITFIFLIIIFTAGYLNLSSKRIIKYINIQ
jgi:hypothetical protein